MLKKIEVNKEGKKAAIVSLGTRISLDSTNVRSVDFVYLREYIMNILGRSEVDFISLKSRKEKDIDYFKDTKSTDFNNYDEIYIYNASFNPFGGLFKDEALDTFEQLYHFNGDVIYLLADPKMPPMDFSLFLKGRDKDNTYTFGSDRGEDNKRTFDKEVVDNWHDKVWKRMKIAYTGNDYSFYAKQWNDSVNKSRTKSKEAKYVNEDTEWFNLWLFEYYAINEKLDLKLKDYEKIDYPYDLVYFGNNRQNERNKVIKDFFNDKELSKFFIGFDPEMENTDIEKYVKHDDLFELIGKKCLATLIVGDNLHNANVRTPRYFEAMLLDVAAFIWDKFDPNKTYVKDEFLKDFIYVSTRDELKNKIEQLRNNPELYKKIVELERKEVLDQFNHMKF